MSTYKVNDDLYPFNTTVFIRNRWGSDWYTGSGVIVGNNDVLTAAHVVYNDELGGWADECRIYPSWDPDSYNKSNSYYVSTWQRGYTDWDENGDGLLDRGDNEAGSLYELEKDICLISLSEDIGSIYGWMGLKFDFNGGNASKLGYPAKHDFNLMYDEGYIYKDSIDNYFWYYLNDIELNPGDSGGPIYIYSGGDLSYQVVGINASSGDGQGHAVALNAFANSWISEEITSNNYLYDKSFASITSENSVDEGSNISFTFKTHTSEEDVEYIYNLSGISISDIASNELSGKTTINSDGEATFTIGIRADKLTEGTENFTISIGEKSKSISINDTSIDEEAPTIKGPSGSAGDLISSKSINENIAVIHIFNANEPVTWSLSGGVDASKFTVNSSTGSLSFKSAPNYESPIDSDFDNNYIVIVRATDSSSNTSDQTVTISVSDVDEFIATISGTSGNDTLYSTSNDDSIDGGDGTDTLSYTGSFSDYSFTRRVRTLQITDQRTTKFIDGKDTIKNIEYIKFLDQTVEESKVDIVKTYSGNFSEYKFYNKGNGVYQIKNDSGYEDITGLPSLIFTGEKYTSPFRDISAIIDIKGTFDQITGLNTNDAKIFRLYNAAFKRLPDTDGLKYWISKYTSGEDDDRAVASSFLVSSEFKERYGENISDSLYVNTLYKNVLGRNADSFGMNYWLNQLTSGAETRYEVLLGFAESAENQALFTEMTGFA